MDTKVNMPAKKEGHCLSKKGSYSRSGSTDPGQGEEEELPLCLRAGERAGLRIPPYFNPWPDLYNGTEKSHENGLSWETFGLSCFRKYSKKEAGNQQKDYDYDSKGLWVLNTGK